MGGAYTSKPDAEAEVDLPPDWNPDWPNPGPWPPGYTPDLSIVSTPSVTISYDGAAAITSTLYDNDSYGTTDPGESLTYTATMDGASVGMRFSGDTSYATTLTKVFSDLGSSFYGNSESIEFNLEKGESERSIVVTIAGTPWDQSVSDTTTVTVAPASVVVYGYVLRGGSPVSGAYVNVTASFGIPLFVSEEALSDGDGYWEVEFEFSDVEGRTFSAYAIDSADNQGSATTSGLGPATEAGEEIDAGNIDIYQVAELTMTHSPSYTSTPTVGFDVRSSIYPDGWSYTKPSIHHGGDPLAYTNAADGQSPWSHVYSAGTGTITLDDDDVPNGETVKTYVRAYYGGSIDGNGYYTMSFKLDGVEITTDSRTVNIVAGSGTEIKEDDWFSMSADKQSVTIL